MDPIASKYSVWRRLIHQFQIRRDIPFRKKFFVGYDLHGNTYWEFSLDGNMNRLRRKMEPYQEYMFKADYFSTVPPPWLQWLRRTRVEPPTLQELMAEQIRQDGIKMLASQADEKWQSQKLLLEQEQSLKLQTELDRLHQEESKQSKNVTTDSAPNQSINSPNDPWAQANQAHEQDYNPIQSAKIPIRRNK
ncbi:hypothetical protein PSN45_003209 [Yamadazyma tenuis]|uniref:NADH dehydrogenase [ubiquinone] 1 alpha subcomplex subunit n=1 Tax=Candida tenuis (strain ATCC 10573 / BCRC 21748 / CBS 615 / JCM 9827 / NBRC 10315 / NRRL Y-1498 / VKM Y-70) TaxID=590646 RepID=G3AZ07_CANTC|nr:uncharacterized protein CANTEDRAFT_101225 [Yamadazyma tenuis ATCC 10573]EGV65976.1 hypothetical protein CANTEDRAFT_101225 [Yamadazyma tenuis ATCC 10573]WEJ95685.1 hypothetical protein PSN45_003209 [Yamadazyma tenuis]